jgi:hypothetical protein
LHDLYDCSIWQAGRRNNIRAAPFRGAALMRAV